MRPEPLAVARIDGKSNGVHSRAAAGRDSGRSTLAALGHCTGVRLSNSSGHAGRAARLRRQVPPLRIVLPLLFSIMASGPALGQFAAPKDDRFGGGDGRTCQTAVVVLVDGSPEVIRAEKEWFTRRYPGGEKVDQRIVSSPDKKYWFEVIVWRKFDGTDVATCFDVTHAHDVFVENARKSGAR